MPQRLYCELQELIREEKDLSQQANVDNLDKHARVKKRELQLQLALLKTHLEHLKAFGKAVDPELMRQAVDLDYLLMLLTFQDSEFIIGDMTEVRWKRQTIGKAAR